MLDNYGTHKHPKVKEWIERRKAHGLERIVLHFTPTSSSWMNLVERFFRDLTVDCVSDGSFGSVRELASAIETYLQERDLNPGALHLESSRSGDPGENQTRQGGFNRQPLILYSYLQICTLARGGQSSA